ncbi:27680_t:CDS:2, partial [Racocetra persica]
MSIIADDKCFTVTPMHKWSYLGFYKYRYRQDDFSYLFATESFRLMKSLERLAQQDSQEVREKANILITLSITVCIIYLYIAHAITCSMGIPTSWIRYPTSTTMRSNYGSSSDDLRIVVVYGSSSGHFMTHSTREGQLRFPFQAMPTGLLWSAGHYQKPDIKNFWVDIEKQYLEKKNALQTYECRTKIKQKTQVMMKNLADETVLESREMSATMRIYQEESNTDQRLKTSEYTVQSSDSSIFPGIEAESDVFNSENDEDSEANDLDTPDHEKAIDDQKEVKEESNNKAAKENKKGPFRMREQNRIEFAESYRAMDKSYMWKLSSGRIVEELFKLGNDLEFE